jgi:magnesium transporter
MVMFSGLRWFQIVDEKNQCRPLEDLAVALLDADYPPVTQLFFLKDNEFMQLDWAYVRSVNPADKKINVTDLDIARPTKRAEIGSDVLIGDDILDALVLDLLNRRTTRANDLKLEIEGKDLRLRAVDAGMSGMLRRITRGYYNYVNEKELFDWKYIEFLRGDPQAVRSGAGYSLRINRLPAGEIAELSSYIPYLHAAELLTLLPNPKAADTLEAMTPERQLQVFEELDENQALELLKLMSPDIAADIVAYLKTPKMKTYLERLPGKYSERIVQLLRYPEDSVGGVMINDMIFVCSDQTVGETREKLRELLVEPDFISLIFAIDDETSRKLRGILSLRQLMIEEDDKLLKDIIDPYVITLNPFDSANDAAYRIVNNQLAAIPVVEEDGKLIGVMTIDAAIKQIAPLYNNLQGMRIYS